MPVELQTQKPATGTASAAAAAKPAEASDPAFLKIRDIIYQASGIYHSEEKLYLLVAACQRRMALTKGSNARLYCDTLTNPVSRALELRALLNEITIGETCLFRSAAQLTALQNVILPELVATRGKIGIRKLKIWSAGCSTGEEPYTLSMFLLEQKEKLLKDWNFEIQATDLNDRSVETAKAGIYGGYALRNTTDLYKRKYFEPAPGAPGDKLRVNEEVRSHITFSRVNLSDDSKMLFMKGMDLIFCCNVLIYFDMVSKRKVVQHFYSNLQAPGYFFLGHAESLYQVTDQFRLVHLPGTTTYQKPAPNAAPEGAVKK